MVWSEDRENSAYANGGGRVKRLYYVTALCLLPYIALPCLASEYGIIEITSEDTAVIDTKGNDISLHEVLPDDRFERFCKVMNKTEETQAVSLQVSGQKELLTEQIELKLYVDGTVRYEGLIPEEGKIIDLGLFSPQEQGIVKIELHMPKDSGNDYTMQDMKMKLQFYAEEIKDVNTGISDEQLQIWILACMAAFYLVIICYCQGRDRK